MRLRRWELVGKEVEALLWPHTACGGIVFAQSSRVRDVKSMALWVWEWWRGTGKVTYYIVDVLFVLASDTSPEMMMMLRGGAGGTRTKKKKEEVNSLRWWWKIDFDFLGGFLCRSLGSPQTRTLAKLFPQLDSSRSSVLSLMWLYNLSETRNELHFSLSCSVFACLLHSNCRTNEKKRKNVDFLFRQRSRLFAPISTSFFDLLASVI